MVRVGVECYADGAVVHPDADPRRPFGACLVPVAENVLEGTALPATEDAGRLASRVDSRVQTLRCGWWLVLEIAALAFALLAFLPLPYGLADLIAEGLLAAAAAAATAAALVGLRRGRGTERPFWASIAVSAAFFTAASIFSTGLAAGYRPRPTAPGVSDLLQLSAVVLLAALLTSLARYRRAPPVVRVRHFVDILAVTFAVAAGVHAVLILPWYEAIGTTNTAALILASGYPVVGAYLLITTLRNLVGPDMSRWRSWERVIVGSFASFSVGLFLWPVWYASTRTGLGGQPLAVLTRMPWLLGLVLLVLAGVYRRTEPALGWHVAPLEILEPSVGWVGAFVLPVIELAAIPAFGVLAYLWRNDADLNSLYLFSALAMVSAVVARTLLTVADNGDLLSRSVTDPLTGLFNYRYFHERLLEAIATAERYGESVSLALLDVDRFRRLNAAAGHDGGDRALRELATSMRVTVGHAGVVCRLGGDKFGIVFADTSPESALVTCRAVSASLGAIPSTGGRGTTASIGIAGIPEHAANRDALLRAADAAQYWAKCHGGATAVVFSLEIATVPDAAGRIRDLQEGVNLITVRALAAAVDARSAGLEHHSRNVAALAVLLARDLDLDERRTMMLEVAALLHDVGKIGVPDHILNKSGSLNEKESHGLGEHCALGERILAATRLEEILPWVRHHHECWDGSGHPDGLAGVEAPLESRIIALCSAYDSMVSGRTGGPVVSKAAALQEIDLGLGTRFDPDLGERFIRLAGGLGIV